jgi:hypothetical protein
MTLEHWHLWLFRNNRSLDETRPLWGGLAITDRGKHVILQHLLESRGYGHPSSMERTLGEITVAILN